MTAQAKLVPLDTALSTSRRGVIVETLGAFLSRQIPPRPMILAPWLPAQGLAMLYGWRGAGKTWIALGLAYAVAAGGTFLRWRAPAARRVLYVDGEMPAAAMQERLAQIAKASTDEAAADALKIVSADCQNLPLPSLATPDGQKMLAPHMAEADLIVLDNVSTLLGVGDENEAGAWQPIQDWLLDLRRQGKAVLLVHHAGKGGQQRGTSRREDVLDTVIALRRPGDHEPDQGARCEIHMEKARGVHGADAKPFEAALGLRDEAAIWTMRDLEASRDERIRSLSAEGLKQRDIAQELGVGVATVNRALNRKPRGDE